MFENKYKVHPKYDEDSKLAEEFESKEEAEKRCSELNAKMTGIVWVISTVLVNMGW